MWNETHGQQHWFANWMDYYNVGLQSEDTLPDIGLLFLI